MIDSTLVLLYLAYPSARRGVAAKMPVPYHVATPRL